MEVVPVSKHVREHRSLLARAEKRILVRIAGLLPRSITSDHLTLLGLLAMVVAGIAYWASRWNESALLLVVPALAANWFGDSLDGTVARVRDCQRPRYGFYVDHVLDIVGFVLLLSGLALSGYMTPMVALGVMVAYLVVTAEVFLATCVQGVFRLSSLGIGPTELRIILATGTLYLLYSPEIRIGPLGPFLLFDVGGIVTIAGLAFAFIVSAMRNTHALYREEPVRR